MLSLNSQSNYVIISPVKDEENYIATTIDAVIRQSHPPLCWVIVDDGSNDNTASIAASYAKEFPWIQVLTLRRSTARQAGSPVVRAFAAGFETIQDLEFEFVVKLDCDVDIPPDFFEQLLQKFEDDKTLGIASGVYLENHSGKWVPMRMPEYHAAGACKIVRIECFGQIGGFIAARGWDTVDEIRAQMKGWKTRHFEEIQFLHLRNEGSGLGSFSTNYLHGQVFYLTGGGKLFFLLKLLHRFLFGKPFLLGGFVLLLGFVKPWVVRQPRLVTHDESRFYRQLLNRRIVASLPRFASLFVKTKIWSHT